MGKIRNTATTYKYVATDLLTIYLVVSKLQNTKKKKNTNVAPPQKVTILQHIVSINKKLSKEEKEKMKQKCRHLFYLPVSPCLASHFSLVNSKAVMTLLSSPSAKQQGINGTLKHGCPLFGPYNPKQLWSQQVSFGIQKQKVSKGENATLYPHNDGQ